MQEIKELHDAEFTVDKMDTELVCTTLLEKAKIQEVFVAAELLRNRSNNNRDVCSGALPASALATSTPTQHFHNCHLQVLLAPRSLPVYLPSLPHCQSHSSAG